MCSPDAMLVVLSEGDVHYPYFAGYRDWRTARAAGAAVGEEEQRQSGSSFALSPEEHAERRAGWANQEAERVAAIEGAHPYRCTCGGWFKSRGGLTNHIRLRNARDAGRYYKVDGSLLVHAEKPQEEPQSPIRLLETAP